jgi:hypothetical protein
MRGTEDARVDPQENIVAYHEFAAVDFSPNTDAVSAAKRAVLPDDGVSVRNQAECRMRQLKPSADVRLETEFVATTHEPKKQKKGKGQYAQGGPRRPAKQKKAPVEAIRNKNPRTRLKKDNQPPDRLSGSEQMQFVREILQLPHRLMPAMDFIVNHACSQTLLLADVRRAGPRLESCERGFPVGWRFCSPRIMGMAG